MDILHFMTVIPDVGLHDPTFPFKKKQIKKSFTVCSLFARHCARGWHFKEGRDKYDSWSYGVWE